MNTVLIVAPGVIVKHRRRFLTATITVVGSAGLAAAAALFFATMLPSKRARSLGAIVEIDVSTLEPGAQLTAEWRGKPVWVLRRTPETLQRLSDESLRARLPDPDSRVTFQQPDPGRDCG